MVMKRLTKGEVAALTRASYGLPDNSNIDDIGLLAESLRRAASYLAPCRKAPLVRDALRATEGLLSTLESTSLARTVLERLIAVGDLIEQTSEGIREIYLGNPATVRLGAETLLLVGVRPLGLPILPPGSASKLLYRNGLRFLRRDDGMGDSVPGLPEWNRDTWLAAPTTTTPEALIEAYQKRLASASAQTGERPGLTILDSSRSTANYSERWRNPEPSDDGIFIGRRAAEYGARTWSVCVLEGGRLAKFIDLPVTTGIERGRDEAWRLQAAIDAVRGRPQHTIGREQDSTHTSLDFLGPVPSFMSRYLETVGENLPHSPGALFSYLVASADVDSITEFTQATLWMSSTQGAANE